MFNLFRIPKEAKNDREYLYLVANITENHPETKNIDQNTFLNSLDNAILTYLRMCCTREVENKFIVYSDAKQVVERGWFPMPGISDTFPRGYIIPLFFGQIAFIDALSGKKNRK